jgi:hypothetical protein
MILLNVRMSINSRCYDTRRRIQNFMSSVADNTHDVNYSPLANLAVTLTLNFA